MFTVLHLICLPAPALRALRPPVAVTIVAVVVVDVVFAVKLLTFESNDETFSLKLKMVTE